MSVVSRTYTDKKLLTNDVGVVEFVQISVGLCGE